LAQFWIGRFASGFAICGLVSLSRAIIALVAADLSTQRQFAPKQWGIRISQNERANPAHLWLLRARLAAMPLRGA
jgi:hypothetical protein